jgi:PHP domain-containing protein
MAMTGAAARSQQAGYWALEMRTAATREPYDLAAVVHVHSTYSDGTATVPEIVEAAADAEADAVLLTDHDTMQAARDGHEGWHQGVLLLVGLEISPRGGHFLAFGLDHEIEHDGRSEREICDEVERAGALGFPAHPFSQGSRISRTIGRPHPWAELDRCATTGIELWSLVTEAAETCASPRELASFISRPEQVVDHPPRRNLEEWDRLCRSRRVVAIGGLDAHQTGFRFPGGRVLSPLRNARFFRMLRTHVLCERTPTGELEPDRALVMSALRRGRCYLGRDSLATTRGFRFHAEGPSGYLPMGGEAPAGDWTLQARLPLKADLRLVKDGEEVERTSGEALEFETSEPGVYRVHAQLRALGRLRTWILSNPIYLR